MTTLSHNLTQAFQWTLRLLVSVVSILAFLAAISFTLLKTGGKPKAMEFSHRAAGLFATLTSIPKGPYSSTTAAQIASRKSTPVTNKSLTADESPTAEESPAAEESSAAEELTEADKSPPAARVKPARVNPAKIAAVATLEVAPAKASTITRTFTGVMTPAQSSDLGFKRIDRIVKMTVDQGDKVKSGDVLAVLDTRSLLADKAAVLAELRAATATLAELEAGPRKQTIDAARAKLNELQSLVELAKISTARQGRLIAQDASSQKQFDSARLQGAAAESRYQSQMQVVLELEAGTRKEQIEAQKAVIQKLEASIERLEISIEESSLKAPYDAIVSKRMADEGMIVAPGSVVMRLVQQDKPEAWIGVPLSVAADLKAGDNFRVTLANETLDAELKSILPELDAVTRTQTAIFVVDQHSSPRFGQVARLAWQQQQEDVSGFWLPTTALTKGVRGLWSVFVAEPTDTSQDEEQPTYVLRPRNVEVLSIETDRVLLQGTLVPGEFVVSAGVQKLVAGQTVKRILPDSTQ